MNLLALGIQNKDFVADIANDQRVGTRYNIVQDALLRWKPIENHLYSLPEWPLIAQLLTWAANPAVSDKAFELRAGADVERQFRWALQGGLGPLMHRANAADIGIVPQPWRDALLSADLTARVRQGNTVDATLQIIEACADLRVQLTLLKGISVSEQLYPAEHLRPMADIDVLISAQDYGRVESALLEQGYARLESPPINGFHHGAPLHHLHRQVIVELHTSLFDHDSPFCDGTTFHTPNVARWSIASTYHARPVHRLRLELQLAYIASSWFNDLTSLKVHPSFLASLFDAVYLLSTRRQELDWNAMLGWLDSDMAKASLYAMVTFLPRFGVEPLEAETLSRLAANQGLVGPIQRRLIHAMLERWLIGARSWDLPFPPPVPGRYSPSHQFEKKILRRLRAR